MLPLDGSGGAYPSREMDPRWTAIQVREALMGPRRARGYEPRAARRDSICIAVLVVIFLLAMSGLALADVWTDISDATWLASIT